MMWKNARKCPMCFQEQLKVSDSREHKGTICRRRTCLLCGYTFKTLEIAVDDVEKLVSNDALYGKLLILEKERERLLEEVK